MDTRLFLSAYQEPEYGANVIAGWSYVHGLDGYGWLYMVIERYVRVYVIWNIDNTNLCEFKKCGGVFNDLVYNKV